MIALANEIGVGLSNAQQVTQIHDPYTRFVAVGLSQDTEWVLVRLQNGTLVWVPYLIPVP